MSDHARRLLALGRAAPERALDPWRQVTDKADAFFQRVLASRADAVRCQPGCTECCHQDLTVLPAEGLAVARGLAALPGAARAALAAAAAADEEVQRGRRCALLTPSGRCAVYAWRPMICRTHGLPLRADDGRWSSCRLNFTAQDPRPAPEEILNEGLLVAGLTVADALIRRQLDGLPEERIALCALALALA